jgi:SNF2 family DNA or RNA helicase
MKGKLKPYQEAAVKFILDRPKSALLMPTGTGKTIVALMYLKVLDKPAMIICEASKKHIWINENKNFELGLSLTTDLRHPGKIFITSYDWIKNNTEVMEDYDIFVFDEAHCISDPETARYKNISEVLKNKSRVVLLAGYPVENKLNEIFVLSLVTDVLGKNYYHFLYKFFTVIRRNGRIIKTVAKRGSFDNIIALIKDVVFIVDKSEAVPSTVKKETVVVRYELSDYQKGIVNAIAEFGEYDDGKVHVICNDGLSVFSKMMQIISGFVYVEDPTATSTTFDESADKKQKVPVVPVFFDSPNPKLEALQRIVADRSNFLLWYFFDAEYEMLKKFGRCSRLCKLQVDSRGLNLQSFDFAMYFSIPTSGGMYFQSQDRLHRMGRTKDVISVVLVPNGEFGDRLLQMLDRKHKLTKKFIDRLLQVRV